MKKSSKMLVKLFSVLIFLILFWMLSSLWTSREIFLWLILLAVLSLIVIARDFRNLSKRDWFIAFILGILVVFTNPLFAALVSLTYLASCILLKNQERSRELLHPASLLTFSQNVLLGLLVGLVLGAINLYLAQEKIAIPAVFDFQPLLNALRAGIFEETVFRLFFFAFLVALTKKESFSKGENFFVYLILTVPHTLLHFNLRQLDLGSVIILNLLFGLPFALLLRKQGLISAITAHTTVDLIRFLLIGF